VASRPVLVLATPKQSGPTSRMPWPRQIPSSSARPGRSSPELITASYQDIARRRGKKIATTAIARNLLTRAYHLLTDASSGGAPH
jgi:hypothetical protein